MCFPFGLEILRLVYKNVLFKILNGFYVSYLIFLSSEKSSGAPYKSWKKISSKWSAKSIKRSWILHWFQKCAKVLSLAKGKKVFTEKLPFTDFLQKSVFFWEKIFRNFLRQEFYTFLKSAQNSASFDTLCAPNFNQIFSTLIRGTVLFFWEVKRSNEIETV